MPPKAAPPAKAAKGGAAPAAKAPAKAAPAKAAPAKDAKGKAPAKAGAAAPAKDAKAKAADPKAAAAKDPKAAAAGKADPKAAGKGDGKAFPLEKGPTPSKMEPTDITRLYKLPDGDMKTEEDVITKQGYVLEEQVLPFFLLLFTFFFCSKKRSQFFFFLSIQLGKGGFGTVFLARDKKKNTKVACKVCELGKEWSDARVKDMKNVRNSLFLELAQLRF